MCLLTCALCEGAACDFGLVVLMASGWQVKVDKVIVARVNNNIKHLIWSHGICVS